MLTSIESFTRTDQLDELLTSSRIFNAPAGPDDWQILHTRQRAYEMADQSPQVVETLLDGHVDGLHGATSYSLATVLEHGIVPSASIRGLGIVAIGYEHSSLPWQRTWTHVVPWTNAGETIHYAEMRVTPPFTDHYVTPETAEELATRSTDSTGSYASYADSPVEVHMRGVIEEAKLFIANSDRFEGRTFYPIVYGIDSSKLPDTTTVTAQTRSFIKGDTEIGGTIPVAAISTIFAPQNNMDELNTTLSDSNHDIQTAALEDLRSLDASHYAWLMRQIPA